MPLVLLALMFLLSLLVAQVGLNIYLFREWYIYQDLSEAYAWRCLAGGIALLGLNLFGRKIIGWLLSSKARSEDEPTEDEPTIEYSEYSDILRRSDGTCIHIQKEGKEDGDPILLVHGWNANSAEWYYQRKRFRKNYKVFLIDLPGLGKSSRPVNNDYSLDSMARDIEAVIAYANLKNVVLYGHSIGGMIILTYCTKVAKNLGNIKGIILEHTTFTNPVKTALFNKTFVAVQKPILEPLCFLMIGLSPLFWLSKWMSYFNGNLLLSTRFLTFSGSQTSTQLDFISKLSAMAPPSVFARGMLAMFRYDVTEDLGKIDVPALVINAMNDRLTLPSANFELADRLPRGEVVAIENAGHQGLVERHEQVNDAVEKFLKSLVDSKIKENVLQRNSNYYQPFVFNTGNLW